MVSFSFFGYGAFHKLCRLIVYWRPLFISCTGASYGFKRCQPLSDAVSKWAGRALTHLEIGSFVNPIPPREGGGRLCPTHYCLPIWIWKPDDISTSNPKSTNPDSFSWILFLLILKWPPKKNRQKFVKMCRFTIKDWLLASDEQNISLYFVKTLQIG